MSESHVSVNRSTAVKAGRCFRIVLAGVCLAWAAGRCGAQGIAVKDGQKIAFLGDSITANGAATPSGYVRLVISGLEANGVKATAIGAGISGHTSREMVA